MDKQPDRLSQDDGGRSFDEGLKTLDGPDLQLFLDHGQHQHFECEQYVLLRGDDADCLYFVVEGSVEVLLEDADGEMLLNVVSTGGIFGEMGLVSGRRKRSASVKAREPTVLCRVPYPVFLRLAEQNPQLWMALVRQLSSYLWSTTRKLKVLTRMSATERVRDVLQEISHWPDVHVVDGSIELKVSREKIGALAGCSRKTAGAVLRDMELAGELKLCGRAILLPNPGQVDDSESPT